MGYLDQDSQQTVFACNKPGHTLEGTVSCQFYQFPVWSMTIAAAHQGQVQGVVNSILFFNNLGDTCYDKISD